MMGKRLEELKELGWVVWNTVTSFWFYVPMLYFLYVIVQLWAMFFISPLTLVILPVVLLLTYEYKKRKSVELMKLPKVIDKDPSETIDEYLKTLEKEKKK